MQRALTVKGEEARWIKKGGQRDINGNGEGGGKIFQQPSYIISFVPFPLRDDTLRIFFLSS